MFMAFNYNVAHSILYSDVAHSTFIVTATAESKIKEREVGKPIISVYGFRLQFIDGTIECFATA